MTYEKIAEILVKLQKSAKKSQQKVQSITGKICSKKCHKFAQHHPRTSEKVIFKCSETSRGSKTKEAEVASYSSKK